MKSEILVELLLCKISSFGRNQMKLAFQ